MDREHFPDHSVFPLYDQPADARPVSRPIAPSPITAQTPELRDTTALQPPTHPAVDPQHVHRVHHPETSGWRAPAAPAAKTPSEVLPVTPDTPPAPPAVPPDGPPSKEETTANVPPPPLTAPSDRLRALILALSDSSLAATASSPPEAEPSPVAKDSADQSLPEAPPTTKTPSGDVPTVAAGSARPASERRPDEATPAPSHTPRTAANQPGTDIVATTDRQLAEHRRALREAARYGWDTSNPTEVLARATAGGGLTDVIRSQLDPRTAAVVDTAANVLGGGDAEPAASPSQIGRYITEQAQAGQQSVAALVAAAAATERLGRMGYHPPVHGRNAREFRELWTTTDGLLNSGTVYAGNMGMRDSAGAAPLLYGAAAEQIGRMLDPHDPDPYAAHLSIAVAQASVRSYREFGPALGNRCPGAITTYNQAVADGLAQLATERQTLIAALTEYQAAHPDATPQEEDAHAQQVAMEHKFQGSTPIVEATIKLAETLAGNRYGAREAIRREKLMEQTKEARIAAQQAAFEKRSRTYNDGVFASEETLRSNLTNALQSEDPTAILNASMALYENRRDRNGNGVRVERRDLQPQAITLIQHMGSRISAIADGKATPAELIFATDFAKQIGFALPSTSPEVVKAFTDKLQTAVLNGALRYYGTPGKLVTRGDVTTGKVTPTDKGMVKADPRYADVVHEPIFADMHSAVHKLGDKVVAAYVAGYIRSVLKAGEGHNPGNPIVIFRRHRFLAVAAQVQDRALHVDLAQLKAEELAEQQAYDRAVARLTRRRRFGR